MSSAKFIAKNSNTPNIDHLVIFWPKNYLRRHIIQGSTKCFSFVTELNKKSTFHQDKSTTQNQLISLYYWSKLYFPVLNLDELFHFNVSAEKPWLFVWHNMQLNVNWSIFSILASQIGTSSLIPAQDTGYCFPYKTCKAQDNSHAW